MIPSLEDVIRITGLRIYGRAVSGFTYPCYQSLAERLLRLPIGHRSSLVPRVALQESLGLYEAWMNVGESEDEYLERLVRVSWRELASEPGVQADLDLCHFLVLFMGRLLFATRGDAVHCRFLPLLEDLGEVGGYAWGAAFLAHQFDSLGASERQTSTSGFFPFLQVWAYLHLPALGRGDLTRPGLVPFARRWDSRQDSRNLGNQLERLQEAIDSYPYLDVVLQPYLGESDEGQPWLVQARPYFGRSAVNSDATTDDAYLQAYALKYGGKVYKSARHQVDVAGEVASLRTLLYSAVHDREAVQRQTAELQRELERVRSTGASGASSSRGAGDSPSFLEAQLIGAVLRAEEAQRHLEERGQRDELQREIQTVRGERDQLRIRAEAVEARVAEVTRELAVLRMQRSPEDQEEVTRLRTELLAQQAVVRSLQEIMTAIGRSHSRSRSGASASRATGTSVGQYLAGSSSCRRNEKEERRRRGKTSAQSGRGGGEMPPPPDRQEGSGESGGG
ncbi:hypothetical protein Taro_036072 [Colocasia esculenta]|uniref:Aminotransferase-like plant mobile domain-containing protein n=1 Tax=Colocasia esculenta TaxID=4460 RepID=A0A843WCA9_COLES|nr:hypothetical protein [Colocasia esculenta]